VDSCLNITQLKGRKFDIYEIEEEDVLLATSNIEKNSGLSKLNKVTQLTGFSDTVYAETSVTVHQFDILLDILIVNQTNDTLQNLNIELATIGDLKLVERPHPQTLGGFEQRRISTSIKVSSTESGLIFGNIIYDVGQLSKCVVLNEIRIDIMDYILPAECDDSQFRSMWFEFDWENKIVVSTENYGLKEYLDIVSKMTNMKCLTSDDSLVEDCGFLSANLYAKSSFGEDALANLSLEKNGDKLTGFFRIRSKAQGIAAALGDKVHKFQQKKK
jgi:coatomer subunit beta